MMRLIFLLVLFAISILFGIHIKEDPGYALFVLGHWSVEMPIWVTIIILVAALFLFHWLLNLFHIGSSVSRQIHDWRGKRRVRTAHKYTNNGLIDFAQGNWRQAEKKLLKGVVNSDIPLINYLTAARAAQEQGAHDRRDKFLRFAHDVNPDAKIAVGLTQAQLQLNHRQLEQALATLKHLRELAPHHKYVLKLLYKLYVDLCDWESLLSLIPELSRYRIIEVDKLKDLEQLIYRNLLLDSEGVHEKIDAVWENIPYQFRIEPELLTIYVNHLFNNREYEKAEALLRHALKRRWAAKLIDLYSLIPNDNVRKRLHMAESWLKSHPQDPELLLALGRLCKANQIWGKARGYLEKSLEIKPQLKTYVELAQLMEHLDETSLAMDYYRKASAVSD